MKGEINRSSQNKNPGMRRVPSGLRWQTKSNFVIGLLVFALAAHSSACVNKRNLDLFNALKVSKPTNVIRLAQHDSANGRHIDYRARNGLKVLEYVSEGERGYAISSVTKFPGSVYIFTKEIHFFSLDASGAVLSILPRKSNSYSVLICNANSFDFRRDEEAQSLLREFANIFRTEKNLTGPVKAFADEAISVASRSAQK